MSLVLDSCPISYYSTNSQGICFADKGTGFAVRRLIYSWAVRFDPTCPDQPSVLSGLRNLLRSGGVLDLQGLLLSLPPYVADLATDLALVRQTTQTVKNHLRSKFLGS